MSFHKQCLQYLQISKYHYVYFFVNFLIPHHTSMENFGNSTKFLLPIFDDLTILGCEEFEKTQNQINVCSYIKQFVS